MDFSVDPGVQVLSSHPKDENTTTTFTTTVQGCAIESLAVARMKDRGPFIELPPAGMDPTQSLFVSCLYISHVVADLILVVHRK